ncbi:membrane protein [Caballeronia sordidicola]|uniref:Membrane protein n=1 Tax=Caballeronia sordidicola TaxID=196367 RepID=A0A158GG98_CABSO|nr:hypothetical protein [Caballeronia sordidicola]SAL30440.1 membrane protein [Caballeronia sordidicola]
MTDLYADSSRAREERWLTQYYFVRAAFSAVWVAIAFSVGLHSPAIATVLLIAYPAWDAFANYIDMSRSGGLAKARIQAINVAISVITTVAVVVSLRTGMNWVLATFGAWAILSGLLQLGTAASRWKRFGAQWAMILSGAQSGLAGAFFIVQAQTSMSPAIGRVAGYAAVGAIYFLVSALWLSVSRLRRKAA